jgi:predicted DNA binding CopG/RHH family protein
MALAKKPESNQLLSNSNQITSEQQAFINGSKENAAGGEIGPRKTKPVMLRVPEDLLDLIDQKAKESGLKRAAYIVSTVATRIKEEGTK